MGGNLYKLGRKSRKEYLEIENKVRTYLDNTIGEENYSIPRYFNSKEDFGDLDIIIDYNTCMKSDFISNFKSTLNVTNLKRVNRIISTVIDNFQVDLFLTDKSIIKSISSFMDYNIGNFIGKIAKTFDLKYGEKGLYYVYRRENSDHYISEFKITNDKSKIFNFFGLDYSKWENGFNTPEDAFKWVINSDFFSSYKYLKPNASIKDRPEFIRFVNYLKDNNITKDWNSNTLTKEEKRLLVNNTFNISLDEFIHNEIEKEDKYKIFSNKFNGDIVMSLTGLKGKELGEFIREFKNSITNGNINEFENKIISMDDTLIFDTILISFIRYEEKIKAV